jgi:carbonic anhydrase/acetyltransferase-like protein (isoleucine patch superfamily)
MSHPEGPEHVLVEDLQLDPTAFVAPGASVVGRVTMGARSSAWFSAVMRGDMAEITLGEESNLQDGAVIHVDEGFPTHVGRRVTIGHRAIVHGAVVGDGCMIGMGAIVLTGAKVGAGSLVAAGALVREGQEIPPGSLVVGMPARVAGPVKPSHTEAIQRGVDHYVALGEAYRARGYAAGFPYGAEGLVQAPLAREDEVDWERALEVLELTPARLAQALEGLGEEDAARQPAPGRWSVLEVVAHLCDAETRVFAARLEQLLAAGPRDVPRFAATQPAAGGGAAAAAAAPGGALAHVLGAFAAARGASLARLEALGPADWHRTGVHATRGPVTLFEQVRRWAAHDLGHLRQAAGARQAAAGPAARAGTGA